MLNLITLFVLTVTAAVLGNLKSIFLVKGSKSSKYTFMALDSALYILLFKTMVSDNSLAGISVYIVARVVSVYLTDAVLDKFYRETYLMNLYLNKEELKAVSTLLLEKNLSFTTHKGRFLNKSRFYVSIHLSKIQKLELLTELEKINIVNPTYDLTEIKTFGKIQERVN